jgi:hypothetical protein
VHGPAGVALVGLVLALWGYRTAQAGPSTLTRVMLGFGVLAAAMSLLQENPPATSAVFLAASTRTPFFQEVNASTTTTDPNLTSRIPSASSTQPQPASPSRE